MVRCTTGCWNATGNASRKLKLWGLDAPQRIEASGPNGGPIQTEEKLDYSKLNLEELLSLEQLMIKAGAPATKATETLPARFRHIG